MNIIEHAVTPEYIELHKRYQCRECHAWIYYDEGDGHWHHSWER